MPWVRFDDAYALNRKLRRAGRDALLLHFTATCFCARHLTDGLIDSRDFPDLAHEAMLTPEEAAAALTSLIDNNLAETTSAGWVIHDFLDYQPSRAEVLSDRENDRLRKRKSRLSQVESQCDSVGSPGPPVPVPSRTPSSSSSSNGSGKGSVDNPTTTTTIDEVLKALVDTIQAKSNVHNPAGWRRKVLAEKRAEHAGEIAVLLAEYPTAPASMLAARILGEQTPHLAHHRRQEPA